MNVPNATYRIQFTPDFGFPDAVPLVSYLARLGISALYPSPVLAARAGSAHGSDVVDPNRIKEELGGEAALERLFSAVSEAGLGWLQDIVPNHMAYSYDNPILKDVLENGRRSEYYSFFDVAWEYDEPPEELQILAPFLGSFYAEALEQAEIQLTYDHAGFTICYYDQRFPLRLGSYSAILLPRLRELQRDLGKDHPDFVRLLGILYILETLPQHEEPDHPYSDVAFVKQMLWALYESSERIRRHVDENARSLNGEKGKSESFDALDALLNEQNFRLAFWKTATKEINYRRFFSINDLICLRADQEEVFKHTHSLIQRYVAQGKFTGLRVDHVDGLYDPAFYLRRLRAANPDTYIVVEKILQPEEPLPEFLPIQGTTGYEAARVFDGVLCERRNERAFSRIYSRFSQERRPFREICSDKKKLIVNEEMGGDIDNLATALQRISRQYRYGSDITLFGLRRAIVESLAQFPTYRGYLDGEHRRSVDIRWIQEAISAAREKLPGLAYEFDFLEHVLLLDHGESLSDEHRRQWLGFVMRFQQFTGPLMAKGVEDTALYTYNRLLSLNEVGASPAVFGQSVDSFHRFFLDRASTWPHAMNATATHDTKRGEDARARLHVLSEVPGEWDAHVRTWSRANGRFRRGRGAGGSPDRNDEYFFYQTLLGMYPFDQNTTDTLWQRLSAYIVKAVREAKVHTAWVKPDVAYEEAFLRFARSALGNAAFLDDFLPFHRRIAAYGIWNSLSRTMVKCTAPGVPDIYQGTELWDLSLVDPDNRRPVDFELRRSLLDEVIRRYEEPDATLIPELLESRQDGAVKLFLTWRLLQCRREQHALFARGSYVPLSVTGRYAHHVVSFARELSGRRVVVIAPRLLSGVVDDSSLPLGSDVWQDTRVLVDQLAAPEWTDLVSGRQVSGGEISGGQGAISVGHAFEQFPGAVLAAGP